MKKTEKNKYLPYGRQHIDANDIQEVVSVLESDYLTTGKKTIDFEIEFSKKVNVKYAVSCSSGTAALHLSLLAQNLPNERRVIVPAISFLATANIVELSGGKVAGFIFIINLFDLPGNKLLQKKSYFTESLMDFPGH